MFNYVRKIIILAEQLFMFDFAFTGPIYIIIMMVFSINKNNNSVVLVTCFRSYINIIRNCVIVSNV